MGMDFLKIKNLLLVKQEADIKIKIDYSLIGSGFANAGVGAALDNSAAAASFCATTLVSVIAAGATGAISVAGAATGIDATISALVGIVSACCLAAALAFACSASEAFDVV